mgnify:FL=1
MGPIIDKVGALIYKLIVIIDKIHSIIDKHKKTPALDYSEAGISFTFSNAMTNGGSFF